MAVDVNARQLTSEDGVEEAAVDDGDAEDGVDVESETTAPQDNSRFPVRSAIAAGLVIVLILGALAGWLGWLTHQAHAAQHRQQSYLQAARDGAIDLTTVDFSRVDADVQRILDASNGSFHDDFKNRSGPFIDAVKQAQSISQGAVTAAGLESVGEDRAQALVAVTVTTSLAGVPQPQPRAWRMRITLQRVNDQVKVSDVSFVA